MPKYVNLYFIDLQIHLSMTNFFFWINISTYSYVLKAVKPCRVLTYASQQLKLNMTPESRRKPWRIWMIDTWCTRDWTDSSKSREKLLRKNVFVSKPRFRKIWSSSTSAFVSNFSYFNRYNSVFVFLFLRPSVDLLWYFHYILWYSWLSSLILFFCDPFNVVLIKQ